mmetsp:Transcript_1334/g.2998  ORF Transcript_1334/g.2998 Transcript_1334/m.2998 type:complete len:259 (-) Transcript_1334:654-1430(-)
MDRVEDRAVAGRVEDAAQVRVVLAQRGDRLRLGDVTAEGLPRGHPVGQELPVLQRRDVRAEQVRAASLGGEAACVLEHVARVEECLLEQQGAALCHGALDDVVDEVDTLAVQVLRVEQVLARPVRQVVLSDGDGQLVGAVGGQILLDPVGRGVEQVHAEAPHVALEHRVLAATGHAHHDEDMLLPQVLLQARLRERGEARVREAARLVLVARHPLSLVARHRGRLGGGGGGGGSRLILLSQGVLRCPPRRAALPAARA